MEIKTKNFSGPILKTARVYNNDPEKSVEILNIKAIIKIPIDFTPKKINLNGFQGDIITETLTITSQEEEAMEVEPVSFDLAEKIEYQIEEIEKGKVFKINFRNIPDLLGYFKGTMKLKTNYPDKPEIFIPVRANFRKKETVSENTDTGM